MNRYPSILYTMACSSNSRAVGPAKKSDDNVELADKVCTLKLIFVELLKENFQGPKRRFKVHNLSSNWSSSSEFSTQTR
jgi:hypothetical protein